jgi:hypothetical protein
MALQDWFPAVTTTTLATGALWLMRNLIVTRLTKSVEHEFNEKLERLRADFREADERLKADLRSKEAEISMLRSGALSAMASRQMAMDKRRLEAIDQLWTAFNSLGGARALSTTLSVIKFEAAAKYAENDPKTRQFFESIGAGFDQKNIDHASAAKARPFVSAMVWATYTAYLAICMHAVVRWHILRFGLGAKDFSDKDVIAKLVTAALPHYRDYLEKAGPDGYHYILEALEERLLKEIEQMLSGVQADQASIEQAAEILRRSNEVLAEATKKGLKQTGK